MPVTVVVPAPATVPVAEAITVTVVVVVPAPATVPVAEAITVTVTVVVPVAVPAMAPIPLPATVVVAPDGVRSVAAGMTSCVVAITAAPIG
ncbi:hypothetical protein [Streptomyces sp. NPDC097610]|uniref:hypothetical protein n=1 Tax=Streptomyces sp. NPDC097610 TaxID=3157227 RepID=UPI00332B114F